jgi:hypothetical protein
MVKVLEIEGNLTNAEVLDFIKQKRTQHAREDAEDRAAGKNVTSRPANFTSALDKHERHLKSDHYPYKKNPSAYDGGANQEKTLKAFQEMHMERIQVPLSEAFKEKVRNKLLTVKEGQAQLEAGQEKKELTETEWLMIDNHAPTTVELLQPMIEDVENRFTVAELEAIVQCIKETYRANEYGYAKENEQE